MDESMAVETGLMFLAGFGLMLMLFVFVLLFIYIISFWKIFSKHYEEPGWASLIPIWNVWIMSEKTFGEGWYSLILLALSIVSVVLPDEGIFAVIGLIVSLLSIVYTIYFYVSVYKGLNAGTGLIVLAILLPFIGMPIIAFGKDTEYLGPKQHIFMD